MTTLLQTANLKLMDGSAIASSTTDDRDVKGKTLEEAKGIKDEK